jgi:hypothetical protein
MDNVLKFVEIAAGLAFVSGMIVAPLMVLAQRTVWWKKRFKWVAVCALTSWMGFWFFLRDQRGSRPSTPGNSAATRSSH